MTWSLLIVGGLCELVGQLFAEGWLEFTGKEPFAGDLGVVACPDFKGVGEPVVAGLGVFDDAGPLGNCGGLVFDHGGGKSDDGGIACGAGVGLAEPCGGGDGVALAPFFEEYAVEIVAVERVVDRVEIKQPIGGLIGVLLGEAAEVGLDGIGDGVGGIDLEEGSFRRLLDRPLPIGRCCG